MVVGTYRHLFSIKKVVDACETLASRFRILPYSSNVMHLYICITANNTSRIQFELCAEIRFGIVKEVALCDHRGIAILVLFL